MKLDLWSNLKEYDAVNCLGDRNWLWHYTEEDLIIDGNNNKSQNLQKLTESKLQEISSFINKPNIIIAESHPVNLLAAFLAGVIKGANLFLCDPNWQQQEWQQVLSLIEPDLVFAQQETKDLLLGVRDSAVTKVMSPSNLSQESLIMIPTGGSSGKVKFAMHKWSTLSASVRGFQQYFNCQKINSFCTLPLYHVSGLMQFMRSFLTQGNLIICPYRAINKRQIILNKQEYFISLVPTQLQSLIESSSSTLAEFKTVLLGGANISRSLLEKARRLNIPLAPTYGMTETASQIVTLKPDDFLAGNNSSGKVLPHAEITIKPKTNEHGLINLKCDSLCLGYYPHIFDRPQLFTTDDLGYLDNEGYLYLIGRNSQKIITGGKNVFPAEVEAVILATKLVQDVCVVGISDRKWGQAVTAVYVSLQSKQDLDLLKKQIRLQLAKYKQPKNWIEVDSLPRNNRGKINYQKVKAIAKQVIGNR